MACLLSERFLKITISTSLLEVQNNWCWERKQKTKANMNVFRAGAENSSFKEVTEVLQPSKDFEITVSRTEALKCYNTEHWYIVENNEVHNHWQHNVDSPMQNRFTAFQVITCLLVV